MGKHCDDDYHRRRWRWQWWWSLLSGLWGIGWIFRWPLTPTHNQSSINTDVVRKHTAHCFNAHCASHTAHCSTNHKITDIVHCFRVLDKKLCSITMQNVLHIIHWTLLFVALDCMHWTWGKSTSNFSFALYSACTKMHCATVLQSFSH